MLKTILGSKVSMGHTYIQGARVPVTKVLTGPCIVTHIKDEDHDGYWAVQLGFGEKSIKNVTKPILGHLRGAVKDKKTPRFLREVRLNSAPDEKVGDVINATDVLKRGDLVTVTGVSKGKGFAGVVKRWKFAGGPKTHGQSDRERAPGSIGQGTTPGRVLKGKHMAGRMGNERVTIKNLIVAGVDDGGEVLISGAVPGAPGGLLIINKTGSGKLTDLVKETVVAQISEEEQEAQEKAVVEGVKPEAEAEVKEEQNE